MSFLGSHVGGRNETVYDAESAMVGVGVESRPVNSRGVGHGLIESIEPAHELGSEVLF